MALGVSFLQHIKSFTNKSPVISTPILLQVLPFFPPLFAWGRTFRQTSLSLSLSLSFPLFSTGIAFPHIQRKQKNHISVRVSLFLSSTVFFLFCLRGNLLRSCLMFFVSSSFGSWAIIRPCKNPRVSDFWALMKRYANHKGFPSSQKTLRHFEKLNDGNLLFGAVMNPVTDSCLFP